MNLLETEEYLRDLQKRAAAALTEIDGAQFVASDWRSELGSGHSMQLEDGRVFERAGINFSAIAGGTLPPSASARRPELAGRPYRAAGVSAVVHPQNPHCPTVHMNVRVFSSEDSWWFGGGMDLTPCYGYANDCRHFHRVCKTALDAHDDSLYPDFKKRCDEYFFIQHRREPRGIGGVFFDDFCAGSFAFSFKIMRAVGDAFLPAYLPIAHRRKDAAFDQLQRRWQQYRRGRYAEFNLVYDRGTLFGLQSGGRAESILMSLPPTARWGRKPATGEAEERFETEFLRPREWA